MKNWMRIGVVVFVSIGGTMSFGFWSLQEFDNAFENVGASYAAISPYVRKVPTTATTTPMSATSTATTSESSLVTASDQGEIDPKFKLIFTPKKKGVYSGCTYDISWSASTTIRSLEATLIDAGTRKPSGPVTSGISKENDIDADSQTLKWKVGAVVPGTYFIEVSKVNGIEAESRSKTFQINTMPEELDKEEKNNMCRESIAL